MDRMKQRKNGEQKEVKAQFPEIGRVGKISDSTPDVKSPISSEESIWRKEPERAIPQFMVVFVALFVLAGLYAIYSTISSSFKSDTKDSVIENKTITRNEMTQQSQPLPISDIAETTESREVKSNEISQQNTSSFTDNSQQGDYIGKWNDTTTGFFYELYRKNGKIYLNFSDLKTIPCNLHRLKKNEYKFRDDENGLFGYADGVEVYVGKGFEECFDAKGNRYLSNIIMRIKDKQLYVYSNDYDRNVYDELCIAFK